MFTFSNSKAALIFLKINPVIGATLCFFVLGVIAGSVAHEVGHALVGWSFGLQIYSIELTKVVLEHSSNVLVHTLVGVSGGFGQALFALVLFLVGRYLFKRFTANKELLSTDNSRLTPIEQIKHFYKRLLPWVAFGAESVFLALVVHGIISGVLEGFFNSFYIAGAYDARGTLVYVLCLVFSFVVLYSIQKQQLKSKDSVS